MSALVLPCCFFERATTNGGNMLTRITKALCMKDVTGNCWHICMWDPFSMFKKGVKEQVPASLLYTCTIRNNHTIKQALILMFRGKKRTDVTELPALPPPAHLAPAHSLCGPLPVPPVPPPPAVCPVLPCHRWAVWGVRGSGHRAGLWAWRCCRLQCWMGAGQELRLSWEACLWALRARCCRSGALWWREAA